MRKMKDSGIEWIGKIPEEWKLCKPKYLGKIRSGDSITNNKLNDESGYEVFGGNGIIGYYYQYNTEGINIIIGRVGALCGNVRIVDGKKFISDNALIFTCVSDANVKYLYYLFEAFELNRLNTSNAQPLITGFKVLNIVIPFPNLIEQQQIASYLDARCAEIDATSEDIQKEINILEDYKKSLIYNAVSNGITDKEYSYECDEVWGTIPKGWRMVDIKYLFEIVKRIAGKEGYDVLSVTQKGLKIKDITSGDGQLADNYSGYQFVYPTDYVMNHMDLLTGWVDCSDLFGVTSPDYRVFRLRDKSVNNLAFYKYVMQCCYMNKIFYSLGQGVSNLGRWRLQTSSFNNFKVPVPPKAEQDEIASYLDARCSEIDALIADKKKQLELLAEYKKSLIYEYVTGKKEVPLHE